MIELVEIRAVEVAALKRNNVRWGWLIQEHAHHTGSTARAATREIDELIAVGAAVGSIGGRSLAEVYRGERK